MRRTEVKTVSLLLVLVLFVLMAAASGSSETSETKSIKDTSAASASEQEKTSQDTGEKAGTTTEVETTTTTEAAKGVSIEEQVIMDRDNVVITAKEYVTDTIWGDGIKLLVENNSDKNITVSCKALIVNNYMITDLFSCSVAAGKKANETLSLSSSGLKAAGINEVGQVEVYFHVYDSDSWDGIFDTDAVTIRTSAFDTMDTAPDDSGKELYSEGGIRIVGKYVDENSFWGAGILLYIENNSGRNVTVSCDNFSVNGFMLTPIFSCDIYNGKMAIDDITLLSSEMKENDIEKIEEVDLSFHIYDSDSYETIKNTDPISFTVE